MTPPADAAPSTPPTVETNDAAAPSADGPDVPAAPLLPLSLVRAEGLGRGEPVRSWSPLGTVDAAAVADVDPAGAVQLRGETWLLDWWVGAEDRWHHPSGEAAVRQHALGDAPLFETAMRVPGGDVVHRAFGVRASSDSGWDDSAVVVEIENDSAVPVALALVLRPATLDGHGRIARVTTDGPVVRVDGRVAAVLSRPPARAAHGAPGEPAALLARGEDVAADTLSVEAGPDGLELALVVPLPHTATVKVLLPRPARAQRRLLRRSPAPAEPDARWQAPEVEAITSGWELHGAGAARVELPEPLFEPVVRAATRSLVLAAGDGFLGDGHGDQHAGRPDAATRAALVCELLARTGTVEPLGPLARALVGAQRLNGAVELADGSDAAAALLHAAAPLLATGAPGWAEDLLGPVAKVVHRLGRRAGSGLDDAGCLADALGRVAPALRAIGQPEVAEEAERLAAAVAGTAVAEVPGAAVAGAGSGADGGDLVAAVRAIRTRVRAGEADAVAELMELCRLGEPGSLPDAVDEHGVPAGRYGFDPAALAGRAAAVVDLALIETEHGVDLLPAWPREWWGQPVEAYGVRTRWGAASFGVRWHGERPAVLWEVEPGPGVDADATSPVLRAPALDPAWQGTGWSGEALLSPVPVPPTLVAIRGATVAPAPAPVVEPEPPAPEGGTFS